MAAGRYLTLLLLLWLPAALWADEVTPLAVVDGRCTLVLPTPSADEQYFLVIGALSTQRGPHRVTIRSQTSSEAALLPVAETSCDPAWSQRINEWRLHLARRRPIGDAPTPAGPPLAERTFRLAASSAVVRGQLAGVGRACQVYVDAANHEPLADTVAEITRVFDAETLPQAQRLLGRSADIDGDGRFTILLTPQLPAGLGGYVAYQDFERQGGGNRADLMVLSAALRPGPHLRALLAHEYAHAVVYSGTGTARAEEDWLNEGIAHLAEETQGWTNLDYRLAAYHNAPSDYPLVAPDHQQAGLYRCPGHRGAAYLFLRHCAGRHGPDLLRRLVQTPLTGVANLEVAAGEPFADLFRGWSAAPVLTAMNRGNQHLTLKPTGNNFELPPEMPRHADLPLANGQVDLDIAGTAAAYVLLHSPAPPAARVEITAAPTAQLQVSLIRLPANTPRLSVRGIAEAGGVRLEVTAHGSGVTLESVAWSPPQPRGRADLRNEDARVCFPSSALRNGESARSAALAFPTDQPLVFQVRGRGALGQRVTGWWQTPAASTSLRWPTR